MCKMDDIPCSSKDPDEGLQQVQVEKRCTKCIKSLKPLTYELLQRHVQTGTGDQDNSAHRHKKLCYQPFKGRYVTNVEVKPIVIMGNDEKCLTKAIVHGTMKQKRYVVYVHVHLNQATGEDV